MRRMELEGGIEIATFAPPRGFDPLAAAPGELEKYGFPSLPENARHRARYRRVLEHLKNKLHYVPPTFRVNKEKVHGPRRKLETAGTETSTNWSGAVVYAPAGQAFSWVQGDWVVPNVDAPTENQWYYCASWIGIDGDGSADVFQAGVECEVYRSGSSITRSFYPWWEWYPSPEVQITNLPMDPGDMVTMLLCSSQGAGSTKGTVFFANRTTGASTSLVLTAPGTTKLIGNCAEWIVEAPTVGGAQSALADYGEVFFSVCEAETTKGTTVSSGTGNNINLGSASQSNLISPTLVQCLYAGSAPR
jgi:Peptidase A4 family